MIQILAPSQIEDLEQHSPIGWIARTTQASFTFALNGDKNGFVGFFLSTSRGNLAPELAFDQGVGFNEQATLSLKPFRFAFYHVALGNVRGLERIRFRLGHGPAPFRFLAIRARNPIAVAILHYLFNLRYQDIGIVAPDAGTRGLLRGVSDSVTRIAKFFRDVSAGRGIRVQESSVEILPRLKLFLSLEAEAIQEAMDTAVPRHTSEVLISFISPTYNTSARYLADLTRSFTAEKACYAELILSDDGSSHSQTLQSLTEVARHPGIQVLFNKDNAGIAAATNAGLKVACGEWIAFIDHDDQFVAGAVAVIAQAILDHPEADFFYTDEIIADSALRLIGTFCKPAFDSVLLSGVNYINHFSVFRRSRLEALGGLRIDREGSQDYDLLLRYLAEPKAGSIVHIPFLAYVWRRDEQSYSSLNVDKAVANGRRALQDRFNARRQDVVVVPALDPTLHRVQYRDIGGGQKVSVVLPNKDSFSLISQIVEDLQNRTSFPDLEIIIVDNGSTEPSVLALYDRLAGSPSIIVDIVEEPFNFARMSNRGAQLASGGSLLFLNNDLEVTHPDWLDEMVSCLNFPSTGIVGAKLDYPSGLVQHHGVIVGLGEAAGHWYVGEPSADPGLMNRFMVRQTMTAVTAACMLVTRSCFEAIGGFDADAFPIAYNDVDLCLRARTAGYRTIWTPFAKLIHHESATRGSDESETNLARFKSDIAKLQERHATQTFIDDAYSPFYDRRYSKPHLIIPPRLPPARGNLFP